MPFNSIAFAGFLPAAFFVYWSLRRAPLWVRNLFLVAAGSLFYGWLDPRFLPLVFAGSAVDYFVGILLGKGGGPTRRRLLLAASLAVNLGMLGWFKYHDFFVTSFCDLLRLAGLRASPRILGLVLPAGISFYTFQRLTYTIDVYRGDMQPTRNAPAFFAFVLFFPQLLAGPITRARSLLPQFEQGRSFSDPAARDGLRQMLNGFLKKMVIADNLAPLVNGIFDGYRDCGGLTLLVGAFFFAMQVYCDFSGYSDMAIGAARLFGIDLARNFAYPYFSRDVAEFWRRWHISLSNWLREYLYPPLCGRKPSRWRRALGIVVLFVLCGLWHGASWTYVAWGFLWGLWFLPMTLARRWRRHLGTAGEGRMLPGIREALAMSGTFGLALVGWIFFRSPTIADAAGYLAGMVSRPCLGTEVSLWVPMLLACTGLLALEWVQRGRRFLLDIGNLPVWLRWPLYQVALFLILVFGAFGGNEFIYTQF